LSGLSVLARSQTFALTGAKIIIMRFKTSKRDKKKLIWSKTQLEIPK
jgi:hypothetical protein